MKFICVVPNYWGAGSTPDEAKHNAKRAGASSLKIRSVFLVEDDDAYVESIRGDVCYKRGTECRLIEERVPKRKGVK
jgi:hypothetical protein